MNREERRVYDREWHANRSQESKERKQRLQLERLARLRTQVWDYKASHPCVDCGETDPIVLDFDHTADNKISNVSDLANKGTAWDKILIEIEKCEVRCANCHRRVTYYRRLGGVDGK